MKKNCPKCRTALIYATNGGGDVIFKRTESGHREYKAFCSKCDDYLTILDEDSEIVSALKDIFECETPAELAKRLSSKDVKVYTSQISRWNKSGFHKTSELIINELIEEIYRLKSLGK